MRRVVDAALGLAMAACSHAPAPAPAPVPVATSATVVKRNDIIWFRASAEYRGITREVYRSAAEHLPDLVKGLAPESWAVILDADETVLDNTLSERRDADRGLTFSETRWAAWVRELAAPAIPGAVEFTRRVHELGGRVAIVSNRADSLCAPTRENLAKVGVVADIVLCQVGRVSDKNPRFRQVQDGTAMRGVPSLRVVEWIGDNIQDFPALTQATRNDPAGYGDFGVRFFLLPNPIYGSWEHNPEP